jgi:hypothetical protein
VQAEASQPLSSKEVVPCLAGLCSLLLREPPRSERGCVFVAPRSETWTWVVPKHAAWAENLGGLGLHAQPTYVYHANSDRLFPGGEDRHATICPGGESFNEPGTLRRK